MSKKNTKKINKKNRTKIVTLIISVTILILIVGCYFGYKIYLLNIYTLTKPDNVEEVIKGLKNKKEITVNKKSINEEYLTVKDFKIRNDFKDFKLNDRNSELEPFVYTNGKSTITFGSGVEEEQFVDYFTSDEINFFGEDIKDMQSKFADCNRKEFLEKNNINNDIDFYLYASENYYKENNIFMNKNTLMDNYAFNVFSSIFFPVVDELIIIKGDYSGYILKISHEDNTYFDVYIIKDGKRYGFFTNDSRFNDEDYLVDLLGTVEIK